MGRQVTMTYVLSLFYFILFLLLGEGLIRVLHSKDHCVMQMECPWPFQWINLENQVTIGMNRYCFA